MNSVLHKTSLTQSEDRHSLQRFFRLIFSVRSWFACWEVFPILFVASFLRLYGINTTEFDADQADIFRMAHDAVSHGHFVATSNVASVGNFNPPGIIYFLMLPAAFSSDPVWGAAYTALLGVLSVLLTYIFIRRYYGRFAASVGSLFYATAALPIFYSRFMWNQNLLLPFVPIYIFMLFLGAVERRSGWLPPAVFLLGLLFQLHGSASLLIVPLLVTVCIAPKTVRWRDPLLGFFLLVLLYTPYIIWEIFTRFNDISILLNATKLPATIDLQPFAVYALFWSPFNPLTTGIHSLLSPFLLPLNIIAAVTTALIVASGVVALVLALRPSGQAQQATQTKSFSLKLWRWLSFWYSDLAHSPLRTGLCILLVWQIFPLCDLIHRTVKLYPHYLIILMPGPFILLGFFSARVISWSRQQRLRCFHVPAVAGVLLAVIILVQMFGNVVSVFDLTSGRFVDTQLSRPYYNDLASMQQALAQADQVAIQHHYRRIYVDADHATITAFEYLSQQLHTPTTVFNDTCAVLPAPNETALMLVGPYSDFTSALISHFATATLVASPPRLGGSPFRLYTVTSPASNPVAQATLSSEVQWLGSQPFQFLNTSSVVTRWRQLRSLPPSDTTLYSYQMIGGASADIPLVFAVDRKTLQKNLVQGYSFGGSITQCTFNSLYAGDQVLVSFLPPVDKQRALNITVQFATTTRHNIVLDLSNSLVLTLDTYQFLSTPWEQLEMDSGAHIISIPTS